MEREKREYNKDRSEVLQIRLTAKEKLVLQTISKRLKMTNAEFLRYLLKEFSKKEYQRVA